MAGKYDLLRSSNGQFYFNLKAANGKVILTSQRYTTKAHALNGIDSVRANSSVDARYERRTSSSGDPYFVLKAPNAEPIGSSELYSSGSAMENGIASVKRNGTSSRIDDRT